MAARIARSLPGFRDVLNLFTAFPLDGLVKEQENPWSNAWMRGFAAVGSSLRRR
jgi:hypothetical protein